MGRYRFWEALDTVAHFLRLPRWLLRVPCDRHERMIWAQFGTSYCEHATAFNSDAEITCGVCGKPLPVVMTSASGGAS